MPKIAIFCRNFDKKALKVCYSFIVKKLPAA